MKLFFKFCVLLFSFNVYAQEIVALKSGDTILFKNVTYKITGNEITEDKTESYPAIFSKKEEGEYSLDFWSKKKVENYKNNTLVSVFLSGALKTIPSNQVFQWAPVDFSVGAKAPVSYVNGGCLSSDVKVTFPNVTLKESSRDIFFGTINKSVRVYEISYKGTWTADRCGVGRIERLVVFSPDINLVLEDKSISFDRTGFFNNGSSRILVSLN